jgi:hypothetical protein
MQWAGDDTPVPAEVIRAAVVRAREDRGDEIVSPARRLERYLSFAGVLTRVACDGRCSKAWGIDHRPRERVRGGVAWLSDLELGDAPTAPGTYEGGHPKPMLVTDPGDMNRWCVRQCERCVQTPYGTPDVPLVLRDFSRRTWASRDPEQGELVSEPAPADLGDLGDLREVEQALGELERVARALQGAPENAEASARSRFSSSDHRAEDRQPWQIGSLEQICRNQAGDVRALVRRIRQTLGLATPADDRTEAGGALSAPYDRDARD